MSPGEGPVSPGCPVSLGGTMSLGRGPVSPEGVCEPERPHEPGGRSHEPERGSCEPGVGAPAALAEGLGLLLDVRSLWPGPTPPALTIPLQALGEGEYWPAEQSVLPITTLPRQAGGLGTSGAALGVGEGPSKQRRSRRGLGSREEGVEPGSLVLPSLSPGRPRQGAAGGAEGEMGVTGTHARAAERAQDQTAEEPQA